MRIRTAGARATARPHEPGTPGRGTLLPGSADGPGGPCGAYRFQAPPADLPTAPLRKAAGTTAPTTAPARAESTLLQRYADFDGDRRPDTVVRPHRGGTADLIALYPSSTRNRPLITFTTPLSTAG